jgi:ribosomal protein L2
MLLPRLLRSLVAPRLSTRSYATEIWKNVKKSELADSLSRTTELYKTYKPVTPGLRHLKRPLNPHLYPGRPLRLLTIAKRKKGGRNNSGKITVRHRGGGHKRRIRIIDYHRLNPGIHDVVRIEYDPNRSAHIALLFNRDPAAVGNAKWSYIIATEGMRAGDTVQSFRQGIPDGFIPGFKGKMENKSKATDELNTERSAQSLALGLLRSMTVKPGNVLPLRLIPTGTVINTISLKPDGPGILVRSAGSFGQVVAQDDGSRYVHVRLQSGEVRKILRDCSATIGKVSNPLWKNRSLGKAGRSRWLGIRPTVRGVAMNA